MEEDNDSAARGLALADAAPLTGELRALLDSAKGGIMANGRGGSSSKAFTAGHFHIFTGNEDAVMPAGGADFTREVDLLPLAESIRVIPFSFVLPSLPVR